MAFESPGPDAVREIADWFRALADETRVRMLMRLKGGEANVSQLTGELGIAQASVSKHLQVLRRAGIVTPRREGTSMYYRISSEAALHVCQIVCVDVAEHQRRHQEAVEAVSRHLKT